VIDQRQIDLARQCLSSYLTPTPLIACSPLSKEIGQNVWLKLENENVTRSFKIRPALNGLLSQLDDVKTRGVVTSSSGNFAQSVAYAAKLLGVQCEIVMMENTSAHKIHKTRELGATVTLSGPTFESRLEVTARRLEETGAVSLHPFDSWETIAADATVGSEILDQLNGSFDIFVPVSGGGLLSGIVQALQFAGRGDGRVFGVQPKNNGSMALSVGAGKPVGVKGVSSCADALVVSQPGTKAVSLIKDVAQIHLVTEEQLVATHDWFQAWLTKQRPDTLVELSGAISLVPLRYQNFCQFERTVVCVISGGNYSILE
tara:strand:+ start:1258 stop:2205 length:948 start_codon:yes stop_codon:yes gene_type:complete